jgi:hypothetical protein
MQRPNTQYHTIQIGSVVTACLPWAESPSGQAKFTGDDFSFAQFNRETVATDDFVRITNWEEYNQWLAFHFLPELAGWSMQPVPGHQVRKTPSWPRSWANCSL